MPTKKPKPKSQKRNKTKPVSRQRAGSVGVKRSRKTGVKKIKRVKKPIKTRSSKKRSLTPKLFLDNILLKIRNLNLKKPKLSSFQVTILLAILGFNLLFGGALYIAYTKTVLSFKVTPVVTTENRSPQNFPSEIKISSAGISLPVTEANITDGIWEISETGATHLNSSAIPGENSNMVIYAHNKNHLFGNLHQTQINDQIQITTNRGQTYNYQITEIKTVEPTEIEVVLPTDHENLTLYTCTGFLDSKRLIVTAKPVL